MSATTPLTNTTSGQRSRLWPALSEAMRQDGYRTDNCLPAMVIDYDRVNNVATIQPLIKFVKLDNTNASRPPLAKVPVVSLGGGGFHINFPLKQGDIGWIIAADRDLSLFLDKLEESPPNTGRAHKFDDCWFIPDVMRQYTVNSEDDGALVIQSTDGATRIAVFTDHIKITAPTSVTVDTPQATFTGNVEIQKALTVDGDEHVKGTSTIDTDAKVAGISVKGHGHISSSPGNRTSGGMIT